MNDIKSAQICCYSVILSLFMAYLRHIYIPFSTLKFLLWQQKSWFVGLFLHFQYDFACHVDFQEVALNDQSDNQCWETWKFRQRVIKVTKLPFLSAIPTKGKVIKLKKEFIPSKTIDDDGLRSWSCRKSLGQRYNHWKNCLNGKYKWAQFLKIKMTFLSMCKFVVSWFQSTV